MRRIILLLLASVGILALGPVSFSHAQAYKVANLVSDGYVPATTAVSGAGNTSVNLSAGLTGEAHGLFGPIAGSGPNHNGTLVLAVAFLLPFSLFLLRRNLSPRERISLMVPLFLLSFAAGAFMLGCSSSSTAPSVVPSTGQSQNQAR